MNNRYSYNYSPWGEIQYSEQVADGLTFVHTAGHGGIRLSVERVNQLPDCMRNFNSPYHDGGPFFWEEDCEYGWVILAFPNCFTEKHFELAFKQAQSYALEKGSEYQKIALHFTNQQKENGPGSF